MLRDLTKMSLTVVPEAEDHDCYLISETKL